jgi:multiple sugar transport system permease protein
MTAVARSEGRSFTDRSPVARSYRRFLGRASILMFALVIISAYLLPLGYMVTTAFQQPGQSTTPGSPVYPAAPQTVRYEGQDYPVYSVPMADGSTRQLILVEPGRESSVFVDPTDPTATRIDW